jgi:N-acetylmuramoyl-L-alanine amidase
MVIAIKDRININYLLSLLIALTFVCFHTNAKAQGYKVKTVVIDAGHGGQDPGAKGPGGSYEKYIALKVSLLLGEKIQASFPDVKIIYTRKTDVFIPLHERASIANRNSADLFISIHCNAATNRAAYGTETFVLGLHKSEENLEVAKRENSVITLESDYEQMYDGFDPKAPETHILLALNQNAFLEQSTLYASKVQNQFTYKLNRFNRGVKQAGFAVLARTTMPSVLVELGFISNYEEERYLSSSNGQEELATSLFEAFSDYKKAMESGSPQYVLPQAVEVAPVTTPTPTPTQSPAPKPVAEKPAPAVPSTPTPKPEPAPPVVSSAVVFKVQIAARSQPLNIKQAPYNSFKNVSFEEQNGIYKYMVGNFSKHSEAQAQLAELKAKGFPDAFIVVYQQGKRLSAAEAKKHLP